MEKVTIVIPARNEKFLTKTIKDILVKAKEDIDVIAVLENYWPEEIIDDTRVHYLHFGMPRGMRGALNAGVAIARSKYVMKLDAHCMLSEGFDVVLKKVCRPNWVCIPTRLRLDPIEWKTNDGNRHPINYLRMHVEKGEFNFQLWNEKNRDKALDKIRIDDILSMQGSMYFMHRDYWYELELLDEENYGTFRKDPQEISFKAWTTGGKVVRVKDCWYAHLHKGKKFGRGYSTNSGDWRKGDEYVKKWFTDEAWDKQKIPFEHVLRKFADMPGMDTYPWKLPPPEEKKTELYQYLEVAGQPFSKPRPDKKQSKFWNEGKWNTFIKPFLPKKPVDQTFVEMGCNAGLFLKLAEEHGFNRIIGIEKNQTPVAKGLEFRDTIGYKYNILKRKLGSQFHEEGSFDMDELPIADITLMSTFHYYVDINAWIKYVEKLRTKSCYVLIVSRPELELEAHWRARAELKYVRDRYFKDWKQTGLIENVSKKGDPKPRDLYSIMLKSPAIERIPMNVIDLRSSQVSANPMQRALNDLAQQIVADDLFDIFSTDFYRQWSERKKDKWSEKIIRKFVNMKADNMRSVMVDGLKDPILVEYIPEKDTTAIIDGGHRLAILKALGHKSVVVRKI